MKNQKRARTDHLFDSIYHTSIGGGLVAITLAAATIIVAINFGPIARAIHGELNLPQVYRSFNGDGAIIDIQVDGKSVPATNWDSVLKGRYEPHWVQ